VKSPSNAIPPSLQPWFEARRRFNLSHATVQMARELGLNPKKFGSLADTKASPWKAPLAEFIAQCYYKAHKRHSPEVVRSLEQLIKDNEDKKARRRERKAQPSDLDPVVALKQAPPRSTANEA
jgi:hypothetical protein